MAIALHMTAWFTAALVSQVPDVGAAASVPPPAEPRSESSAVAKDEPETPADAAAPAVVEVAPAPAAPAPSEGTPPPAPARPAPTRKRIAVQRVEATDLPERLEPIFTSSLVTELRKLHGASVIGMDEVKELLEMEADRQALGCESDSCASELADALGADVVVIARLARIGDEHVASFRRLDAGTAQARGVDSRFAAGDGEELLAAIGPAVAELFPELPLRVGVERGVSKEAGKRLNPPPIPVWAFATTASVSGALLLTGVGAGLMAAVLTSSVQERIDDSVDAPVDGADLKRDFDIAQRSALVANIGWIGGAAGVLATGVLALFTDFWGYGAVE